MAEKRKSSEMGQQVHKTRTGDDLERDLDVFCQKAHLQLPYDPRKSPAKQNQTDVKQKVRNRYVTLWWTNQAALRRVELKFYEYIGSTAGKLLSDTEKTKQLYDLLQKSVEQSATPQKSRSRDFVSLQEEEEDDDDDLSALSSPTTSKKGLRAHFPVSKSKESSEPVTSMEPPPIPFDSKPRPTPPSSQQTRITSAPTSANTSFATTVANTSFHSFWSNPPATSQETVTSSFNESFPPKIVMDDESESNYISSVSTSIADQFRKCAENVESSQQWKNSNSTDKTVRPRVFDAPDVSSPRDSQSTFYGTSWTPSEIEPLVAKAEAGINSHPKNVEIINTASAGLPDDRAEAPKRQKVAEYTDRPPAHTGRPSPAITPLNKAPSFLHLSSSSVFAGLPVAVQWEAHRILQSKLMSVTELDNRWRQRTLLGLYRLLSQDRIAFQRGFEQDQPDDILDEVTLSAKLQWRESLDGALFDLSLQCPKKTSSLLQRKLGFDRVMYLEMPDLSKPPKALSGIDAKEAFQTFACQVHEMLGRQWITYFLKKGDNHTSKLMLISGRDQMELVQALQWSLPYNSNAYQMACKAYMRFELHLTRTISVAVLEPHEIAYKVKDLTATADPDDRSFEDPKLSRFFYEEYDATTVMNDGCNEMCLWIAAEYARMKGLDTIPSALQIRVAGAKGVWFTMHDGRRNLNERPTDVLMRISDSQIKLFRDLLGSDDAWRSVNVVKHAGPPRPSFLYSGFLPILFDRGVSREAIREEVHNQVKKDLEEFLNALRAPGTLALRQWMQSHNEYWESKNRDAGIEDLSGFPRCREERIIMTIEAGFDPKGCKWLANEVHAMAKDVFALKNKNFQARLAQSTMLMGIADPEGCLEPGEIHCCFDKPFTDTKTGTTLMQLEGMQCLAARHPAIGPSDIQKVRVVRKPELAHIRNVVVYPTKGMRPLANKLQGGDYDGDRFWMTWSPRLTEHFKNAPAPWKPPPPEHYGIRRDTSRLSDRIKNPDSLDEWCHWLGDSAFARLTSSGAATLGIVTNYIEQLAYTQGRVNTKEILDLIPLHDYLVDADKQGYRFTPADFNAYKKKAGLPQKLAEPAYWKFTKNEASTRVNEDERSGRNDIKEKEKNRYPVAQAAVEGNIIDMVYFDVIEPLVTDALKQARTILESAGTYDSDLTRFYSQTMEDGDNQIRQELSQLKQDLEKVRQVWKQNLNTGSFVERVQKTRNAYDEVVPNDESHPRVQEWTRRQGHGLTIWERLKASAFAAFHYNTNSPGIIIFNVSGYELCALKADEQGPYKRTMLPSQYNLLKPRKMKLLITGDDDDKIYDSEGPGDDWAYEEDTAYY